MVFVPENMVAARREAIEREGADIVVVRGNYDNAIAQVHCLSDIMTVVEPAYKVHGCKVNPLVWSIFGGSQSSNSYTN